MLNNNEWLLINDIILIIHSTENINTMCNYFFDAIKPLVLFEKAIFYLLKEENNGIHLENPVFINADFDFFKSYESLFKNSRYGRVAVNTRRTIAFRDSDLIQDAVRTNTDIYKTFLSPNDLPYGGGMIIAENGILLAEFAFFRTEHQGDFTNKEIYILDILKKHLQIRLMREQKFINKENLTSDNTLKLIELGLTSREIEITKLIINNLSTSEISDKLNISIYTTKKHISNIFEKLKINSRLQLIQLFSKL